MYTTVSTVHVFLYGVVVAVHFATLSFSLPLLLFIEIYMYKVLDTACTVLATEIRPP